MLLSEVVEVKNNDNEYEQIEDMLQKQENLNRTLIKKQLEFREERTNLLQELQTEKIKVRKLSEHVATLT